MKKLFLGFVFLLAMTIVNPACSYAFSSIDFEGTWNFSMLTSGQSPQWTGWAYGSTTMNSSGAGTWIAITRSDENNSLPPHSMNLSISPSGIVSVGGASFPGAMSNDKSLIVLTGNDGGGGYNLIISQRSGGAFNASDLVGTWNLHGLNVGSTTNPGWFYGTDVISSNGNSNMTTYMSNGTTSPNQQETLSIDYSSGIVSAAGHSSASGRIVMSNDKTMMIGVSNDSGGGYDLIIFMKTGGTYEISDLQGEGTQYGLVAGSVPGWFYGSYSSNAPGGMTWSSYLDSNGSTWISSSGPAFSMDTGGIITVPSIPALKFHGMLNQQKNIFVYVFSGYPGSNQSIGGDILGVGVISPEVSLYGSFTGAGIWKWDGTSWTQATPNNPLQMVASESNLYGSFTGGGIWKWDGMNWIQVTHNNPQSMVMLGSNLYGSFISAGIWKWDGTNWTQVTHNNPDLMVTSGSNLYGSFAGGGIWKWDGLIWTQVTPNNPQSMVILGPNLYGSFAGGGIWKWDGSTWTQVTPNNPLLLVASGENLYGSFSGGGIWKWDGTNWTQATPNNPQQMVASVSNLYGSFVGGGVWKWDGATWSQVTPNNPASMVLGY